MAFAGALVNSSNLKCREKGSQMKKRRSVQRREVRENHRSTFSEVISILDTILTS